ncbi:exosortase system-associated protein, TIGR04073 family [Methylomonas sp. AM2-LC]|uniref:exosortase system-associated protein, TIGR04073 family n=1 Tax=Methylomonas sp. AM2-LC TaxID=3153301 RepID=UPI0032679EF6
MNRSSCKLITILTTILLTAAPSVYADYNNEQYSDIVVRKLGSGFANISTGLLEIPKDMIIDTNQSNFVYGVTGGILQGSISAVGRIGTGIMDLLSAPLPTQPVAYPVYIWDDFDAITRFGPIFRLENTQ